MEEDVQALIGDCFLTVPISLKDVEQKKGEVGSTEEVDRIGEVPTAFSRTYPLQRAMPRKPASFFETHQEAALKIYREDPQ